MKLRSIFIFLAFLSFSSPAWAANANDMCRYISFVDTNNNRQVDANEAAVVIQNAFENYTRHPSIDRSAFALCFEAFSEEIEDPFAHSNPLPSLSLNSTAGGKPVYIFGLHLNNYQHTLSLSGNQPIYLVDSSLNGCTNCLSINGRAFGVENVNIQCASKDNGSVGLKLIGSRHRVERESNISNCATGIQIGDTGRQYGDFMQIRQSAIHTNGTAIKVVKGVGNKFVENSVYENDNTGDDIFDANEGISLARRQQGDVKRPEVVSSLKNEALGKTFIEILPFYPLNKFEMEVSLTGENVEANMEPKHKQGREFYEVANLKEVKENGNYVFEVNTPPGDDRVLAVAMVHHNDLGSSSYSQPVDLRVGILSSPAMESRGEAAGGGNVAGAGAQIGEGAIGGGNDAVTAGAGSAAGDGTGTGGSEMIGGDSVTSAPAAIPPSPDDEDEKGGGDEMSAAPSSPAGDTPAVISGGVDAVGAPGGFGAKGGCGSLSAAVPGSPVMLFSFLLTLATLLGLRQKTQ